MDLKTKYLGLELSSPIVASAGPLWNKVDHIRQAEDAGAGAVVLFSLFEEQIKQETAFHPSNSGAHSEHLSSFPEETNYHLNLPQYLDLIRQARETVDIPIIASLNGTSEGGWIEYARELEAAGAHALELNIFFIPAGLYLDGRSVEQRYFDILHSVKQHLSIPVSLKLNPYFSSMGFTARQLCSAGADGLVLFNRFYEPDIDIDRIALENTLDLSTHRELRLPLMWIGILSGKLPLSLAASTGVESHREVIKYLLAGADVVMSTSALLRYGIGHLQVMTNGLKAWMAEHDFSNVSAFRGKLSQRHIVNPTAYERANYLRIINPS